MFSGIVQSTGMVEAVVAQPQFFELHVNTGREFCRDIAIGSSVSVHGVCLTVSSCEEGILRFELSTETRKRTMLGNLQKNQTVNLERAVTLGQEIGGHVVSGHVDTTGTILKKTDDESGVVFDIEVSEMYTKYLFDKGFVSINGVSLTVNKMRGGTFEVHLIPETLHRTTFGALNKGDLVNIELDKQTQVIVETVERIMREKNNL